MQRGPRPRRLLVALQLVAIERQSVTTDEAYHLYAGLPVTLEQYVPALLETPEEEIHGHAASAPSPSAGSPT